MIRLTDGLDFLPEKDRGLLELLREDFPQLTHTELVPIALMAWGSERCEEIEGRSSGKDRELRKEQVLCVEMVLFGFHMVHRLKMKSRLSQTQRRHISDWIGWELKDGKVCRMKQEA